MFDDFFWYVWRVIFQSEHLKKTSMQFLFKTEVHLDPTACPLVANPEILYIHGWSRFLGHLPFYLVKVFNLSFQNMVRERQTNEVLGSLNFTSFVLTFEGLKTKTYVFLLVIRFFLKEKTLQELQTSLAAETLDLRVPEKTLPACPVRIKRRGFLPGGKSICRKLSGGGVNNWNGGMDRVSWGGLWELHGSGTENTTFMHLSLPSDPTS